jgi:hypothetical protein
MASHTRAMRKYLEQKKNIYLVFSLLNILSLEKCISFWEKHQYAKRPDLCKELFHNCPDNIQRIHYSKLSVEEFREKFEKPGIPVIITGLAESMNPEKYWTFDVLLVFFLIIL